jgi:hypothetical protein
MVSELLYADKPYSEIAGYDSTMLRWVIARPRDKYGRLKRRGNLPPWVEVDDKGMRVVTRPVAFQTMFRQVAKSKGLELEQIDKEWKEYQAANPKLGVGGVLSNG